MRVIVNRRINKKMNVFNRYLPIFYFQMKEKYLRKVNIDFVKIYRGILRVCLRAIFVFLQENKEIGRNISILEDKVRFEMLLRRNMKI